MKYATVHLDRERKLRYPMAAVEEIEERFGINIVGGESLQPTGTGDMVWLAWLGLYHAGETPDYEPTWWERLKAHFGLWKPPELTEEHVAEWVDMQNVMEFAEAMHEAMGKQVDATEMQEDADPTVADPEATTEAAKSR